ncbi:MAG: DUF2589 domain-containing protein [Rhodospirillales bacterium]|nr:MAG: DUF2589 domain-containing protein [Rhodospirillales bacterium]
MPNGANNDDPKRTIIKLFDLGELIAAPVTALLEADYQSARRVIDLIQHFGFEPPEGEDAEVSDEAGFPRRFGKMRTVSFVVRRQQGAKSVPYVIRVPLLSLVPLPLLQIKEADFDFSVRVVGGFIEDGVGQALPDQETAPGLGPVTRDGPMLMGAPPPGESAPEKPRPRRPQGPPAGVIPLRRRPRRRRAVSPGEPTGAGMLLGATPTERGRDGAAEEPPQRLMFSATLGRDGAAVPRDGSASLRAEGNMKVHITMRQGDMPEGIAQLLNMLTQQISREELPPEAQAPDQDKPAPDRDESEGEDDQGSEATNGSDPDSEKRDDDRDPEENAT